MADFTNFFPSGGASGGGSGGLEPNITLNNITVNGPIPASLGVGALNRTFITNSSVDFGGLPGASPHVNKISTTDANPQVLYNVPAITNGVALLGVGARMTLTGGRDFSGTTYNVTWAGFDVSINIDGLTTTYTGVGAHSQSWNGNVDINPVAQTFIIGELPLLARRDYFEQVGTGTGIGRSAGGYGGIAPIGQIVAPRTRDADGIWSQAVVDGVQLFTNPPFGYDHFRYGLGWILAENNINMTVTMPNEVRTGSSTNLTVEAFSYTYEF